MPNRMAMTLQSPLTACLRASKTTAMTDSVTNATANEVPAGDLASPARELLGVRDLTVRFGGMTALDRVELNVGVGETVAVIGPNGAGKTTLFNCVTRTYRNHSGDIHFDGGNITRSRDFAAARRGIARTFQHPVLFPEMTVAENIAFGFDLNNPIGYIDALCRPRKVAKASMARRARVDELMERLDLSSIRDARATTLAQGHRRLVELGRALAMSPKLLLLDEPVAGLNTEESERFAQLLRELRETDKISLLLIEHDLPFVLGLADRIVVLNFGQVIASGPPSEIQSDPRVIKAYLGTVGDAA
jgi:branched-chain amino acid transport system ATP-binding protein